MSLYIPSANLDHKSQKHLMRLHMTIISFLKQGGNPNRPDFQTMYNSIEDEQLEKRLKIVVKLQKLVQVELNKAHISDLYDINKVL